MKTAIFLGAGASASEGAPIQTNLFRDYFKLVKQRNKTQIANHETELFNFFRLMFDIDVANNLENDLFPTFEEALGVLDLADMKNESFKDFTNINFSSNSGKIKFLRLYLVFLMADIINDSLKKSKKIHAQLIKNLVQNRTLDNTVFLTTNYDILCDNAISSNHNINYGIDFANFHEAQNNNLNSPTIKLLKLHGSLNWLHCPTCNNLQITPNVKGVYRLMIDPSVSKCRKCNTFYSPIIVPPTFYKDLSKVFLSQVWNKAENELLDIEHLIFCGYSFPDADIHIKYLIKRIQKNRTLNPLKITVVNNHNGKSKQITDEEQIRFKRFLGNGVNYTNYSFEEFAKNPQLIML